MKLFYTILLIILLIIIGFVLITSLHKILFGKIILAISSGFLASALLNLISLKKK